MQPVSEPAIRQVGSAIAVSRRNRNEKPIIISICVTDFCKRLRLGSEIVTGAVV